MTPAPFKPTAAALIGLAVLLAFTPTAQAIDIGTAEQHRRQRFDLWGTSIAWMGNELGGWSTTGPRDQLVDLLFDGANGLGLNFARYKISAGQNPSLGPIPRPGADMEGWVPNAPSSVTDTSTWQWDWNADATQRWFLDEAIAHGVTNVEAFANSAPWWMTISQDATGAPNQGQANLSTGRFDEFAHYLAEVVDHFDNNLGIRFDTLAPMNEPGAEWWTSPGNQEGMNVPKGAEQALLIQAVGSEIQDRGQGVRLVAPEETSALDTLNSWQNPAYDAATKAHVYQVNTHTYPFRGGSDTSTLQQLYSAVEADGKKVFASEFAVGDPGSALGGGITLANRITTDLRNLRTPGWTYWQAIENNNGSGWGLIIAPFEGPEQFFLRHQYQVMRQFTSFIRPGAHILESSDPETVAAYDARTDTTTIVFTNDESSSDTNTYDLLDKSPAFTRVIRTSAGESYQALGPASINGQTATVTGPGNSVTTIVIHHKPNLLQNSSFDRGGAPNGASTINGWEVWGGGFYNFADNTGDGGGAAALWADNPANSGQVFQTGVGDANTDLTGVAFEFSADLMFQNEGSAFYNADTYLAIEFYGTDDEVLSHQSVNDFQTRVEPSIGINTNVATDSEFRTFRTERFVAPAGTRYVRPVIRYGNVGAGSTDWLYVDNAYLQEVHPLANGREWTSTGGGAWSDADNWTRHAQVDRNQHLYLGDAITNASIIAVTSDESLASLTFFSDQEYTISGSGILTLANASEAALIDVRWGSHTISAPVELGNETTAQVLPGASVTFDNGLDLKGASLTKLGQGGLDLAMGFAMGDGRLRAYATAEATISVGPDALLDGEFQLLLAPGQAAGLGATFELIAYDSLTSGFDSIVLPQLADGLAWSLQYGTDALTASVIDSTLPGDFDGDGVVSSADYSLWRGVVGSATEALLSGNGNGVGGVDGDDYTLWRETFGDSLTPLMVLGKARPVPEISTMAMSLILMAVCPRR